MTRGRAPRIVRAFLRRLGAREDREFLVADLDEEYDALRAAKGVRHARRWYREQAARSTLPLIRSRIQSWRGETSMVPTRSVLMRWVRDVRFALRGLGASRAHTSVAILTLALGIGINAAVFSIVDSVLLRPLPFPSADRLTRLWNQQLPQGFSYEGFSPALVGAWRRQTDLFERVEASTAASFVYEHGTGASMIAGAYVTPELLSMLGARPLLGRLFAPGDGRTGAARLAVVSESFWRGELAGDRGVVSRRIRLDGHEFAVIGVAPSSFRYPTELQQIWIPYDVEQPPVETHAGERFAVMARRRDDLTASEVADRVKARGAEVHVAAGQAPVPGGKGTLTARAVPVGDSVADRTERSLWVLAGAVGFLLLIVCANVASLTLSRALARVRDLSVRSALGAGRRDLIRVTLIEHGLIAGAGALMGVGVGKLALLATSAMLPESMTLRAFNVIDLDDRALLFLVAVTIITALLVCLPPVLIASRTTVADVLRHASRSTTGSTAARRFRSGLVVSEVALALVLLVGAALMTRSLVNLQQIDIGLDPEGLVSTQLAMPQPGFADPSARDQFFDALLARLRAMPGVTAASAGGLPPRTTAVSYGPLEFADRPGERSKPVVLSAYEIWPEFFRAAGIRLVDGRVFSADRTAPEVIVSAGFAAKHWPRGGAVGQRFRVGGGDWLTVVGVTSDVREMSEDDTTDESEVYYPRGGLQNAMYATGPTSLIAAYETVVVRTDRPAAAAQMIARAVSRVDPRVVVARTTLAEHQFAQSIARPRIVFLMMSVFGGFGLVLAAGGIYGVLSCLVTQRLRELGLRLALGASPAQVFRLVLGSGLRLTAAGLLVGLGLALALVRMMRSLLYDVEATDPISVLAVITVLTVSAALAAWWPARRAMRVNPITLLREE
ncbi:MAG TPA: ABC transporter permease [Vicinamibacterales bacterium]|nr:ABC transporter permease [Vicinamibacterales bacterium]